MRHNRQNPRSMTTKRFLALSRVGTALTGEMDEERLLHLITQTACEVTGAAFAAFSLRPVDEEGQTLVAAKGALFHLTAVVGITSEQEEVFRRMPLGGEGLLAPIFCQGVPVRVADVLAHATATSTPPEVREAAQKAARAYAQGQLPADALPSLGVPVGHPVVRSFLGVPLLDRSGGVRGGLLLGHGEPGQFSEDDQVILMSLAGQAAIALENARLSRLAGLRTQELQVLFENMADGLTLVDQEGRIRRENEEHAQQLRLQASLIALAHDAILVRDPHDHIISWNRGAEQLYGWTAQQAQGQVTDTLLQTRFPISQEAVDRLLYQGGQWEGELTHTCRDGHLVVVESRQILLRDRQGQPKAILQINRDISERRRLEQEAHAHLGVLQTILDELPSAIYLAHGPEARLVLANRATESVFRATWPPGQPLRAFLAQHGIRYFRPDGRTLAYEHMAVVRALQQGETVRQEQKVIRYPDGTTLPILVNALPLDATQVPMLPGMEQASSMAGEAERVALVVYQDITTLKEAEALKDEFLSIATHELRSPVAVLKGYADLLLRQSARVRDVPLSEAQQEGLREIARSATRLDDLTRDLLDISRPQAEQPGRFAEPTDLVALAERVVKRQQVTTQRHHLTLHAAHRPLTVNIDPRRLEQVLVNLLDNAIKYSPQGGPVEVELSRGTQGEEEVALLSIRDHGMGIPAQQQARIFGRFVRAENARAAEIAGTGLGLYLSRELIERNGGRMWFESTEGVGTTFFVTLPLMVAK